MEAACLLLFNTCYATSFLVASGFAIMQQTYMCFYTDEEEPVICSEDTHVYEVDGERIPLLPI